MSVTTTAAQRAELASQRPDCAIYQKRCSQPPVADASEDAASVPCKHQHQGDSCATTVKNRRVAVAEGQRRLLESDSKDSLSPVAAAPSEPLTMFEAPATGPPPTCRCSMWTRCEANDPWGLHWRCAGCGVAVSEAERQYRASPKLWRCCAALASYASAKSRS